MIGQKIDLIGQKFGRLSVVKLSKKREWNHRMWLCRCDCGNLIYARGHCLASGKKKSCGCLLKDRCEQDDSYTRLYRIWLGIKSRCLNPNFPGYKYYGGKNRKICGEWKTDYTIFKKWALKSGYQDNLTIDRINNNGDYEPDNCQWLTRSENIKKYWRLDRCTE